MSNLIVVLMGGLSGERKISLLTGKACSKALKKKGYKVVDLDAKGYFVESSKVEMLPKNLHKINDENSEKAISLLNEIEDHDDIKSIYTNFEPAD